MLFHPGLFSGAASLAVAIAIGVMIHEPDDGRPIDLGRL